MTKNKIIIGIVLVVIGLAIGLYSSKGDNTLGSQIGTSEVRTNPVWFYGGAGFGSSGQAVNNLVFGTCNLTGQTTLSTGTSSIAKMDCVATGVKSGDVVDVQLPNTATSSWTIVGASASTTSGYIQVLLNNTSATTTIPTTVKNGVQYKAFR